MIEERASVTRVDGKWAEIELHRQNACGHCELNKGCGTGAIGRMLGHRSKPVRILNGPGLKVGDNVVLGLPEQAVFRASLLVYGLPLLGLIGAGLFSQWLLGESEILALVFALTGFMAGLVASATIARNNYSSQYSPQILEVSGEPPHKT